jgi:hypothetical protein
MRAPTRQGKPFSYQHGVWSQRPEKKKTRECNQGQPQPQPQPQPQLQQAKPAPSPARDPPLTHRSLAATPQSGWATPRNGSQPHRTAGWSSSSTPGTPPECAPPRYQGRRQLHGRTRYNHRGVDSRQRSQAPRDATHPESKGRVARQCQPKFKLSGRMAIWCAPHHCHHRASLHHMLTQTSQTMQDDIMCVDRGEGGPQTPAGHEAHNPT